MSSVAYQKITEDEFSRIGGEPPEHRKIEEALVKLGGAGIKGNEFKRAALKAAGLGYGKMTSYGSKPEAAARAFNRVAGVLQTATDADSLLAALAGE
ncbi:MAG: hypothetical protein JRF56_19485 [Deltaproteobacteria bacterium]|jgi:hypothetical protein|nr:hypothetical protein [Deltaproteobacteria bacterium]